MNALGSSRRWFRGAIVLLAGLMLVPLVYIFCHGDFICEALYAHHSEKHIGLRVSKGWGMRYERGLRNGGIDFLWVGPSVLYQTPASMSGLIDHRFTVKPD